MPLTEFLSGFASCFWNCFRLACSDSYVIVLVLFAVFAALFGFIYRFSARRF